MSRFKAVLFDYDDTLVESFPARVESAKKAIEGVLDSGLDIEHIMREWAGRPQMDIWLDLSGDCQTAEMLLDRYMRWYWSEATKSVRLFPGILEALQELKARGVSLAIVTSKARRVDNGEGGYGVETEMERMGLSDVFDVVVGWPDVKESKPAPAPILFALDRLGMDMDKGDALMVGDSHIDVTAARRAGVASAAATWGTLDGDLLSQAGPDYTLRSPAELGPLMDQRGPGPNG